MRRLALVLAALLAFPASAQGWAKASQGWGKISSSGGGATGLTYNSTTDTVTGTGAIVAKNLTASGLATPGAITVTPVLTMVGSITTVAGSALVDGDGLVVKYTLAGTIPLEFDLSPGDGTTGGAIPVLFTAGDSADLIRDNLILAINAAAPAALTASSGGAATVALTLDVPGVIGGTNTEAVADAGFAVTGFVNPTAATTYTYKLVWRLPDGTTTEAGAASSTAAGHATLSVANRNDLSWAAGPAGTVTDVYRTVGGATQGKIATGITATSLSDTGLAGGGETAPTKNGTGVVTALTATIGAGGVTVTGPVSVTASNSITLALGIVSGNNKFSLGYLGIKGQDVWTIEWSSTSLYTGATDLKLARAAANTLAQTGTANAPQFQRLYSSNGGYREIGSTTELLTIAAAATTDSTANLLPAGAYITGVTVRVTTLIPTAATFTVGDATTAARFATGVAVAANTTATGMTHLDQTGAAGPLQATAAKIRITPNATPAAATGVVRLTVYYEKWVPPTS